MRDIKELIKLLEGIEASGNDKLNEVSEGYYDGIREQLQELREAIGAAIDIASNLSRQASEVPGPFSGQINSYLIGHLESFMDDPRQPGSVASLEEMLDDVDMEDYDEEELGETYFDETGMVSEEFEGESYDMSEPVEEAEYRGRKVSLNKPMQGDVKKFKVYVKDPSTGNIKKVNFGDPNMRIKKSNPARRKSFRARHNCANPGPKTKARYWSCRKW